jgi:hypothetical protein
MPKKTTGIATLAELIDRQFEIEAQKQRTEMELRQLEDTAAAAVLDGVDPTETLRQISNLANLGMALERAATGAGTRRAAIVAEMRKRKADELRVPLATKYRELKAIEERSAELLAKLSELELHAGFAYTNADALQGQPDGRGGVLITRSSILRREIGEIEATALRAEAQPVRELRMEGATSMDQIIRAVLSTLSAAVPTLADLRAFCDACESAAAKKHRTFGEHPRRAFVFWDDNGRILPESQLYCEGLVEMVTGPYSYQQIPDHVSGTFKPRAVEGVQSLA